MLSETIRFIDRYIPGYHFFGRGVVAGGVIPQNRQRTWPPWLPDLASESATSSAARERPSMLLQITIGEDRQVLDVKGLSRSGDIVKEQDIPIGAPAE